LSPVRQQHGFTLIEVLVAIALTAIVFGATLSVLDVFQRDNRSAQLRHENQDEARNAMDMISRQLRNVAAPSAGSPGALLIIKKYSMVFDTIDSGSSYAWGENTSHTMMVRYCLDNSNPENEILWQQVKRWKTTSEVTPTPVGCPDTSGFFESNRQMAQHIVNRIEGRNIYPLFVYSAATAPQTASVEINMFLNIHPKHNAGESVPNETQLTTGIGLRNANRPPIAEFTATQVNEFMRLDASGSYDPDGLALTYKWWKDGVAQESTNRVYEVKETKGNHTYELEVVDPGGLGTKTPPKEVTVK
jgi:prepilin-type N-terminal cleavage/methylation domain-containing protein